MTMVRDVRVGIRNLVQRPLFTTAAVLTLALGVGANTAIFSILYAVVLKPLPFEAPERLVMLWQTNEGRDVERDLVSPANFADWREQQSSFEDLAAVHAMSFNVRVGRPERIEGARVSPSLFSLLRVDAQQGRTLAEGDSADAVVLGHSYWVRRFGADPSVVGRSITVDGQPRTVVGVMPRDFDFPQGAEIFVPFVPAPQELALRDSVYLLVIGRLQDDTTLAEAAAGMGLVGQQLARQYPANEGWSVRVTSLTDQTAERLGPSLKVLLGAVFFVLLVACANVANLVLARGVSREREMATRAALGATPGQLVRQLLTESLLLALLGGGIGVLLAFAAVEVVPGLSPVPMERLDEATINLPVLAFVLAISLVSGLIFGLVPALRSASPRLVAALREAGRGSSGGRRSRLLERGLVVAEITLAMILLVGAGLMFRSLRELQQVGPGFEPENRLTAKMLISEERYGELGPRRAFYSGLIQRLEALPGVRRASAVTTLPLSGSRISYYFTIDGREYSAESTPAAGYDVVMPGYFETLGIPLVRGRAFTDRDTENQPRVVVVSASTAERFWRGSDAVGESIRFEDGGPAYEVVGVVGDVRHGPLDFGQDSRIYVPYEQDSRRSMYLVVETTGPPRNLVPVLTSALVAMDPEETASMIEPLDEIVARSFGQPRLVLALLLVFALLALVLASIGIYGVMAHAVSRRVHEIGIRMALGAGRRQVMLLVVGQALLLVAVGLVLGAAGGYGLTRAVSELLSGIETNDPLTFVVLAVVMVLVAVAATLGPARRATRIDPAVALRAE